MSNNSSNWHLPWGGWKRDRDFIDSVHTTDDYCFANDNNCAGVSGAKHLRGQPGDAVHQEDDCVWHVHRNCAAGVQLRCRATRRNAAYFRLWRSN
jgi:hypothetical protein